MPAIAWERPVPSSFDPLALKTQYVETCPTVTFPTEGDKFHYVLTGEYTTDQVFAKGANMISKYSTLEPHLVASAGALISGGKTVDDVSRPENTGLTPAGGGPEDWAVWTDGTQYNKAYYPNGPLTEAQAYARAGSTDIGHRISIYESEEGLSWIQPGHPQWRGWYQRIKERREAYWKVGKGMTWMVAHNYYTLNPFSRATSNNNGNTDGVSWWTLGDATESQQVAKFQRTISQWERSNYLPGGTLSPTNLICDGIYMSPETIKGGVLRTIWRALIAKKMGYFFCVYAASTFEWRPNNFNSHVYRAADHPGSGNYGVWFRADKTPISQENFIAYTMAALIFGNGCYTWAGKGKETSVKKNWGWLSNDKWYPNQVNSDGSDTGQYNQEVEPGSGIYSHLANSFPYYANPGEDTGGATNYMALGANMYCRTHGQTVGGTLSVCEYRIDGGAWVTAQPTMEQAVARAYFGKQYLVVCERKSGKASFSAFNNFPASHLKHTIDIKHPTNGTIYSGTVCGEAWYCATVTE